MCKPHLIGLLFNGSVVTLSQFLNPRSSLFLLSRDEPYPFSVTSHHLLSICFLWADAGRVIDPDELNGVE